MRMRDYSVYTHFVFSQEEKTHNKHLKYTDVHQKDHIKDTVLKSEFPAYRNRGKFLVRNKQEDAQLVAYYTISRH